MNVNTSFSSENGRFFLTNLESDREYLLRSAMTHDWEAVQQFCAFLEEYSSANPYSATRHLCSSQLLACDQYGNSVLQACCYYRPPVGAIRSILRASHKLSCYDDLIHHRSLDRSTALQVACATGSSVAVVEALLVTTTPPASSKVGRSDTSSRSDEADATETATASATTRKKRNRFLHPGTLVWASDQQGATPLSDLVVQYTLERKGPRHVRHSKALEQVHDIDVECATSPIFQLFWSKVELLVEAAWSALYGTTTTPTMSLLHKAAAIASTCPALLTDLLMRCCWQDHADGRNESWLPLHYMLVQERAPAVSSDAETPVCLIQQHEYFLDRLLQSFPQSASLSFGAIIPRSPLTYALLRGWQWYSMYEGEGGGGFRITVPPPPLVSSFPNVTNLAIADAELPPEPVVSTGTSHHFYPVGPIQRICSVAPNTIGQCDAVTGLYSWQLAAAATPTIPMSTSSLAVHESELRQIETIYHLLRLVPHTMQP